MSSSITACATPPPTMTEEVAKKINSAIEKSDILHMNGTELLITAKGFHVLVRNLDPNLSIGDVFGTLEQFGTILSCRLEPELENLPMNMAIVYYERKEYAAYLVKNLHAKIFQLGYVYAEFLNSCFVCSASMHFTSLKVLNLPDSMNNEELYELFESNGKILSCSVHRESDGNRIGIVTFAVMEAAFAAGDDLNNKIYRGHLLEVQPAMFLRESPEESPVEPEELQLKEEIQTELPNSHITSPPLKEEWQVGRKFSDMRRARRRFDRRPRASNWNKRINGFENERKFEGKTEAPVQTENKKPTSTIKKSLNCENKMEDKMSIDKENLWSHEVEEMDIPKKVPLTKNSKQPRPLMPSKFFNGKIEDQKLDSRRQNFGLTLHVKNLCKSATEKDIEDLFGVHGSLGRVVVRPDHNRHSQVGTAFGTVTFKYHGDACKALAALNGFSYQGFSLDVFRPHERMRYAMTVSRG